MYDAISIVKDGRQNCRPDKLTLEGIMKSPIISKENIDINISSEIMAFALKVGVSTCALIGIWSVCCLLAGLVSSGAVQMARGYITAITGF